MYLLIAIYIYIILPPTTHTITHKRNILLYSKYDTCFQKQRVHRQILEISDNDILFATKHNSMYNFKKKLQENRELCYTYTNM